MRNNYLTWFCGVWALCLAVVAGAQQVSPHIAYVYPAGGRQGSTFQVKIGGQFFDGVTNVYISGGEARATVAEHVKPLTQKQFNDLREKMQELVKNKKKDAATWKEIAEIRKKLLTYNRNANPALADKATLQVTISSNAAPGHRELRLGTPMGLSNPLIFEVSQLPEFSAKAPNSGEDTGDRIRKKPVRNPDQQSATPATETAVSLPCVVNGQIMPGGVERFRFPARKGQHIVAVVSARELIPYLPDAVPGWFQATLGLYDIRGKELAYDDDFRFHPDPVLHFEIPADGTYVLEIKDSIYRGREDFVYRVTIGELPFVTSIFPLGGKVGRETPLEIKGWNLASSNLMHQCGSTPGIEWIVVTNAGHVANRVPFAVDTLPERLEQEPNNLIASAQNVTLPIIINGRIDKPGDQDVFRFTGQAGDQIVAEVYARRLDSPLDSILKIADDSGKQLAANDDHDDKGSGLNTHHADSLVTLTLPTTGAYYVILGDTQRKGGAEYSYRLRITAPQPDFALRMVPASINVRAPGAVPVTIYALRKDGFTNAIDLQLKDAPAGFRLSGARIPENQESVRVTLSGAATPRDEPVSLQIQGRATVAGREIVRAAVPAEDMMQAFAYRHLVPMQQAEVAVLGRGRARKTFTGGNSQSVVRIPAGGTANVQIDAPLIALSDRIHLELSDPPEGVTIQKVSPLRGGTEIVLASDLSKAKPGVAGNLIVQAFAEKGNSTKNPKNKSNKSRAPIGTLPAIPFEIISSKTTAPATR